jgi:hypothetical protein
MTRSGLSCGICGQEFQVPLELHPGDKEGLKFAITCFTAEHTDKHAGQEVIFNLDTLEGAGQSKRKALG